MTFTFFVGYNSACYAVIEAPKAGCETDISVGLSTVQDLDRIAE
jgi:hypothetical protein